MNIQSLTANESSYESFTHQLLIVNNKFSLCVEKIAKFVEEKISTLEREEEIKKFIDEMSVFEDFIFQIKKETIQKLVELLKKFRKIQEENPTAAILLATIDRILGIFDKESNKGAKADNAAGLDAQKDFKLKKLNKKEIVEMHSLYTEK